MRRATATAMATAMVTALCLFHRCLTCSISNQLLTRQALKQGKRVVVRGMAAVSFNKSYVTFDLSKRDWSRDGAMSFRLSIRSLNCSDDLRDLEKLKDAEMEKRKSSAGGMRRKRALQGEGNALGKRKFGEDGVDETVDAHIGAAADVCGGGCNGCNRSYCIVSASSTSASGNEQ